jgi:hypothetical protein
MLKSINFEEMRCFFLIGHSEKMSLSSIRNFFPSTGIVNSIITQMHERVALAFSQRPETTSPENRQYDYYPIVFIWASGMLYIRDS